MAPSKVIVLTGASRGIGLAMAHFLLKASQRLVVVARTEGPLLELKKLYPGQVEVVAADLADFGVAKKAVSLALESFSRIDGLVLNHGVLGAVRRVADASAEDWRTSFDVNFFSGVAFIQAAIPSLRLTKGCIILVSSGAAVKAYTTWGAYGSAKAAINHLALTLKHEEPLITAISIRPGVVDTAMQVAIREEHSTNMDEQESQKFHGLHKAGELLKPEQPGNVMSRLVLNAPAELSGMTFSWNDPELAEFQDP